MKNTIIKISAAVRKTVQEEQFEPISIELGIEKVVSCEGQEAKEEQKNMAKELLFVVDELIADRTGRNLPRRRR